MAKKTNKEKKTRKKILGSVADLIRKMVSSATKAIGSVLGPILSRIGRAVGKAFDRLPGSGFMRRRARGLKSRFVSVRQHIRDLPPLTQIPSWAIRGAWNGLQIPVIRWKAALISGAIFMFVLFLFTVQFPLTTNPEFCGSCHSMRPEFTTHKVSSHRRITCYSCHVKPGLYWLIRDHFIDGPLGMYREFVSGYHDPMVFSGHYGVTRMPVENCRRCHSPEARRFTPSVGIKMDGEAHEKHLEQGLTCVICHNRITHPIQGYKNNLKMQACFRCHGSVKDEEFIEELEHLAETKPELDHYAKTVEAVEEDLSKPDCRQCHSAEWELKPRSHLLADWAPTQSYETPTYLGESQAEAWEYQAQKISLQPKPAEHNRIYQHARYAKGNTSYCYMCHNRETFCAECHEVDMPHVDPWWDRHGEEVLASFPDSLSSKPSTIEENIEKVVCTNCHNSRDFCLDCHVKTVFPHATPWAPVHGKLAKKEGFREVCQTCHNEEKFCNQCHNGVEMPHGSRWLGAHYAYLRDKSTDVCMRCHTQNQCEKCHSRHGNHEEHLISDPNKFGTPPQRRTE